MQKAKGSIQTKPAASAFISRVKSRAARVGVVGLGYVGLPLVMEFCRAGFEVIGFDIDPEKARKLNRGESYIGHIPAAAIKQLISGGKFSATTDFARSPEADAILICVPTPLTPQREPDLSFIENTGRAIAPFLRKGQLIVLESTTYPGTTDEVLKPILESGGLKCGRDFLLAYSPEREDPGNPNFSTGKIPKVVGGCDHGALDAADALYSAIVVKTVRVSSARTAEAVKLTENIFRCINIALVNELKMIYTKMGIDVWEVIEAAKTKPFGFMPFYPGPGFGGHCIQIDPFYLSWKVREYDCPARFIELAGEINTSMPAYVIENLAAALNDQAKSVNKAKILILGLAYKKNVDDMRESPSLRLIEMLRARGAKVDYYDPYIPVIRPSREHPNLTGLKSIRWNPKAIAKYDAVLIATDHSNVDYAALARSARLIIDSRNALGGISAVGSKIVKA
ncbi:nucleotide sugar dehydrogenase [Candidatus Sumerlaeota bacterium]|nr:nucleotide sugar dehydrogenase [Candidatus Sumerlaeota bacterium]